MTLGHRLRIIRQLRGLSQEKIASELGMSTAGYSKIERNETDVNFSRLESICLALKVSMADLFGADTPPNLKGPTDSTVIETNRTSKLPDERPLAGENTVYSLRESLEALKAEIQALNTSIENLTRLLASNDPKLPLS